MSVIPLVKLNMTTTENYHERAPKDSKKIEMREEVRLDT
jgi:hypothetical protein